MDDIKSSGTDNAFKMGNVAKKFETGNGAICMKIITEPFFKFFKNVNVFWMFFLQKGFQRKMSLCVPLMGAGNFSVCSPSLSCIW